MVGSSENLSTPGVVTFSKYFAGGERRKVKDSGNDNTEEKVRKSPLRSRPTLYYQEEGDSTVNSGAWFKDIDQPSSLQGKFIHRAESGVVEEAFTIHNSCEANWEDLEREKKRNPFAVKLKTKEFTSASHHPLPSDPKFSALHVLHGWCFSHLLQSRSW